MNGIINVNKQVGVSSAREVGVIKRVTGGRCGHMGTLDPMAGGVLPIAVGNACRLFDYFLDKRKEYVAEFRFGVDYDTLDTTGALIKSGERVPDESEILGVLGSFVGEIEQVPPIYSAKCVGGKRGYQLARAGVEFSLPPKKVKIYGVELCGFNGEDVYKFKIKCGGGTYIRSIARDMAKMLGTVAAMSSLTRTASGKFSLENAVSTSEINAGNVENYLIPADKLLDMESCSFNGAQAKMIMNGVPVECDISDGDYKMYLNGVFYGVSTVKNGIVKVRTKLC